jgi:hypothetical protein
MKHIKSYLIIGLIVIGGILTSCGDDDVPPEENEGEVIDLVTLTFIPQNGGSSVIAKAVGPQGLNFETEVINLDINKTYDLAIKVENSEEGENITEEIEEEAKEHMFFFSFTAGIFSDPAGDGNVDNRSDDINYNDQDGDGNPVGLTTTWTTANTASANGDFQVILKHQPDGIKTATSTSNDGESDIELTWTININD